MATTTRQRLAGGFVIGAVGVAFYLGMQFNGPGLGGSGSGDGGPAPGAATGPSVAVSESAPDSELAGDPPVLVTTTTPSAKLPTFVAVVISGSDYLLSATGDESKATPAKLSEVASAAVHSAGDGQGIRVRVFRNKDATAGAKIDLFSKLDDAGIPLESIQEMRDFLD